VGWLLNPVNRDVVLEDPDDEEEIMGNWEDVLKTDGVHQASGDDPEPRADQLSGEAQGLGSEAALYAQELVKLKGMTCSCLVGGPWSLQAATCVPWHWLCCRQNVTASNCERAWSVYGGIQRRGRHNLRLDRLQKTARVSFNRRAAEHFTEKQEQEREDLQQKIEELQKRPPGQLEWHWHRRVIQAQLVWQCQTRASSYYCQWSLCQ